MLSGTDWQPVVAVGSGCGADGGPWNVDFLEAGLVLQNGVGVVQATKALGYESRGCVTGPALMLNACDWGRERTARHLGPFDRKNRNMLRLKDLKQKQQTAPTSDNQPLP